MLSFLAGLISGFLNVLNTFLPDSPLQSWISQSNAVTLGLGWLNWFFPLGDCIVIFGLYCALLVTVVVVRMVISKSFNLVGTLMGE